MMSDMTDQRRYAPAAERNQAPIRTVLAKVLPPTGTVLEIASGTGQHAAFCAPRLAPRHWLPSDPNPTAQASIRAWVAATAITELYDPLDLDVTLPNWFQAVTTWQTTVGSSAPPLSAIVTINMIHIAPWSACEGLLAGAEQLLPPAGVLYLYGPFRQNGKHTAPSNEAFDASLRSQNPAWGVRNLDDVVALAAQHHLQFSEAIAMPANNRSIVFTRS